MKANENYQIRIKEAMEMLNVASPTTARNKIILARKALNIEPPKILSVAKFKEYYGV